MACLTSRVFMYSSHHESLMHMSPPTAWAVGLFCSACRQNVTGAAAITFVVKTPAAAAGASATISARSALGPFARIPENMPVGALASFLVS